MKARLLVWIAQYGAWGLFAALVLGILGLPVPDEVLLTYTGYLAHSGHLALWFAMPAAFAGSVCGITLSFALGRALGSHRIERVAGRLGATPEHLRQVRDWFERRGKWTLVFGYYVPGVRHLTALVAGASHLPLPVFTAFAWSGALAWSQSFILLGYWAGKGWERVSERAHHTGLFLTACAAVGLVVFLVRRGARAGFRRRHNRGQ